MNVPAPGRRKVYLVLLAAWVALTFVLTSIPDAGIALPAPFLDKVLHMSFYAVTGLFGALWRRASGDSSREAILAGLACAAVAGAVDEIHQHWIPGRSADLLDWIADAAGGGIGAASTPRLTGRFRFLLTE